MCLRSLHPLGDFARVDRLLAVSDKAILWLSPAPVCECDDSFSVSARRLLRAETRAPLVAGAHNIGAQCYITAAEPMTSSESTSFHATCVLPLSSSSSTCTSVTQTAVFATSSVLFIPVVYEYSTVVIMRYSSSSPLFDEDVSFSAVSSIQWPGFNFLLEISLALICPSPADPDHFCLLTHEHWQTGRIGIRQKMHCYRVGRDNGIVATRTVIMDVPLDQEALFASDCQSERAAAQALGRRAYLNAGKFFRQNSTGSWRESPAKFPQPSGMEWRLLYASPLEPTKLFTSAVYRSSAFLEESKTLLIVAPSGEMETINADRARRRSCFGFSSPKVASSQNGRIVIVFGSTVYTAFSGTAHPRLEEAARASCYHLLSEQQKATLCETKAHGFNAFVAFSDMPEGHTPLK